MSKNYNLQINLSFSDENDKHALAFTAAICQFIELSEHLSAVVEKTDLCEISEESIRTVERSE